MRYVRFEPVQEASEGTYLCSSGRLWEVEDALEFVGVDSDAVVRNEPAEEGYFRDQYG